MRLVIFNTAYLIDNLSPLSEKLATHLYLCGLAMLTAMIIALPLGVIIAKTRTTCKIVLSLTSITQTVPSLAAMAFLIPIFGIGVLPTLLILAFYAIYPILKNTVVGVQGVPQESVEAAKAMGFNAWQRLYLVEFPLAMPTIVAGVRISMAMTIGIATIAAFIGAGGLGDFITQGLALNDMKLVLLGAVPAAMLALIGDFLMSLWERALVGRAQRHVGLVTILIIVLLGGFLTVLHFGARLAEEKPRTIVVASKNFTEQYILAEIIAQLIERSTDLLVTRKINLGTTDMVHQAMLLGDVDIYPEYTGTAYTTILHKEDSLAPERVFEIVQSAYAKNYDLMWLSPLGFSNSQTLAVRNDLAKRHNLATISDLARVSAQFTIGAPAEFIARKDAYPKLRYVYGLSFASIKQMEPNLMYTAIAHSKIDVMVAFATDGRLSDMDLVVLRDDKNASLAYQAALVVRGSVLRQNPKLNPILAKLAGAIDEKSMTAMNAAVEQGGQSTAEVARQFLKNISIDIYRP